MDADKLVDRLRELMRSMVTRDYVITNCNKLVNELSKLKEDCDVELAKMEVATLVRAEVRELIGIINDVIMLYNYTQYYKEIKARNDIPNDDANWCRWFEDKSEWLDEYLAYRSKSGLFTIR